MQLEYSGFPRNHVQRQLYCIHSVHHRTLQFKGNLNTVLKIKKRTSLPSLISQQFKRYCCESDIYHFINEGSHQITLTVLF